MCNLRKFRPILAFTPAFVTASLASLKVRPGEPRNPFTALNILFLACFLAEPFLTRGMSAFLCNISGLLAAAEGAEKQALLIYKFQIDY